MGSQPVELSQNKLERMAGCQVSSSTDVNNNNHRAGYFRSLSSTSSDCGVTSTSDYNLSIETTDFRRNTTASEHVSSTTVDSNFENATFIEQLIIDVIH